MLPAATRTIERGTAAGCAALAAGQAVLLALLLHLSAPAAVATGLLAGLPLALMCHRLLARYGARRQVQLTVAMGAAGGFGLLLGCAADFGALGLYGLLSLCRSLPAGAWPTLEQVAASVDLMPWAWLGMMLGSNAAMALDALQRRAEPLGRLLGTYAVCNAGMLLGMVTVERITTRLTFELGQTAAAVAMVAAIVAGMVLGMNLLLAAARAVRFLSVFPAR